MLSLDEQLSEESFSGDDVPSSYGAIKEIDEDDEKEQFQVVRRKQQKKTQKYSILCKWRSKCKRGLKCQYHHTDDEKNSLQNTVKIWNVPIRVRADMDLPNVFTLIRIKTVFAATVTVGDT